MKKTEEKQDLPFASIILQEYKDQNQQLIKQNKFLKVLTIMLVILFAIETTYIIACWDTMHPSAGLIQNSGK